MQAHLTKVRKSNRKIFWKKFWSVNPKKAPIAMDIKNSVDTEEKNDWVLMPSTMFMLLKNDF